MSEHTPEPWRVVSNYRIHADIKSSCVAVAMCGDPEYSDAYVKEACLRWAADAERIVMCVNAMQGMPDMKPGSVRKLVEALEKQIAEWEAFRYSGYVPPEDGDARYYAQEAIRDCADQLRKLLSEALRELGEPEEL